MGKLTEWEKGLLMQDAARIDENPRQVFCVASMHVRFNIYALVVYGIAAIIAVLVFMWGQT